MFTASELWSDEEWERRQDEEAAHIKTLSDSLRPCVRHGNPAHIEGGMDGETIIISTECGCWCGLEYFGTLDEAVEHWNDQPQIDRLKERIAELEAQPPAAGEVKP